MRTVFHKKSIIGCAMTVGTICFAIGYYTAYIPDGFLGLLLCAGAGAAITYAWMIFCPLWHFEEV